jgi:hypothetical protein
MTPSHADEGMWLFNQVPREKLDQAYGFRPTDAFLDHLRLAAVRFGRGGSASFVSPDGLMFTNHHVGRECIQRLSTPAADYMAQGFWAATAADEKRCPGLEVSVLTRIEDVTAAVNHGVEPSMDDAAANQKRKANAAALEVVCSSRAGHKCEVTPLYSGGLYHLYEYRRYTDVRLVFAPEYEMAIFGGDADNFNYPRYGLDFAFFRAYQDDGRPAKVEHWLRWSRAGAAEGDLALVAGHPATTGRLLTVAQLEFQRDISLPLSLDRLTALIRAIEAFAARSAENRRLTRSLMRSVQNSFKSASGELAGLRRSALMDRKRSEEKALREAVDARPEWKQQYGGAWAEIEQAYAACREIQEPYYALETAMAFGSDLLRMARGVVRVPVERAKPDALRLPEYTESRMAGVEQNLFAPVPVSAALETVMVAAYLEFLSRHLGAGDPTVMALLGGQTPQAVAAAAVASSRLQDVAERRRLASSAEAVAQSGDGMIRLMRLIDPAARAVRKRYEDAVEAVERGAGARLARARFAVYGTGSYPDATRTLRLTWGVVRGYGRQPWATTVGGLIARDTGVEPTRMAPSWVAARAKLDPGTAYNFVSTADIHGGNSGSPTVNRSSEIIGIVFDGNLESLPNTFLYTDTEARAIHVSSQVIILALGKVYKAGRLLNELGFGDGR